MNIESTFERTRTPQDETGKLAVPLWQTWLERDLIPDRMIRLGIRSLLRRRLNEESESDASRQHERFMEFLQKLRESPIAIDTDSANNQHYEVPAEFFELVLGVHKKYSSGLWSPSVSSLDEAEQAALDLVIRRAQIEDGMDILELGCGWGSLSLELARRFPRAQILSVSNSTSQREFIEGRRREGGVENLTIMTADMNELDLDLTFDRIVSVEMFEHMRNYRVLLKKISRWMKSDALLFVHIFSHLHRAYPFEIRDESDWMARYFFTGGIMPSDHLLLYFQEDLAIREHWWIDGTHYQRTAEAWLENLDQERAAVEEIFANVYGPAEVTKWIVRWRVFFMSCAELFGYDDGQQWGLSHYVFERQAAR